MMRKMVMTAGAIALASVALVAFAAGGGLPKGATKGPQETSGPLGFPPLKKFAESLGLTHDQEQSVLRIYNEFHKKEHEAMQEASKKDSSGKSSTPVDTKAMRGDMVTEIKAVLTEDQRKKLDGLVADFGKKKKA
jgi:Spy/CpxP family protein refolding chaperone